MCVGETGGVPAIDGPNDRTANAIHQHPKRVRKDCASLGLIFKQVWYSSPPTGNQTEEQAIKFSTAVYNKGLIYLRCIYISEIPRMICG